MHYGERPLLTLEENKNNAENKNHYPTTLLFIYRQRNREVAISPDSLSGDRQFKSVFRNEFLSVFFGLQYGDAGL